MSTVIADIYGTRKDFPTINIRNSMIETHFSDENWFSTFNRDCEKLIIMGVENSSSVMSMVTLRGQITDPKYIDDLRISGVRCPIHTMKCVSSIEGVVIVDIVFALDPSYSIKDGSSLIMDISFPKGFTPMCYVSQYSTLQYIAARFEPLGIVSTDISPIGFNILWGQGDPCNVSIFCDGNLLNTIPNQTHKIEMTNMDPNTLYTVSLSNGDTISIKTTPMTVANMTQYVKIKTDINNVVDLSLLHPVHTAYLRENSILGMGQIVNVQGELDLNVNIYKAKVATPGDTVTVEGGGNVYLVPNFETVDQCFCMNVGGENHVIGFDNTESFVSHDGNVYTHGDKFVLSNHFVQVAKGSLILVVQDDVPIDFPGGDAIAAQVLTSGDIVVKDLIMRTSTQVVEKVTGSTTYGLSSYYVYDSSTGIALECSRISHGLNDAKDTGSIKFSVLYTDSLGAQSLIDTVNTNPEETSIRSKTDTADLTATFGTGGLYFDTDEGDIYFGADKDFRIHFQEISGLDPAMLQIQALSGSEYVTRFLVTSEP